MLSALNSNNPMGPVIKIDDATQQRIDNLIKEFQVGRVEGENGE